MLAAVQQQSISAPACPELRERRALKGTIRQCVECGVSFEPGTKDQKCCGAVCAKACFLKFRAAQIPTKTCPQCCVQFRAKVNKYSTFCSRECAFAFKSARKAVRLAAKEWHHWYYATCKICGQRFLKKRSNQSVCESRVCRAEMHRHDKERARKCSRAKYERRRASLSPTVSKSCLQCGQHFAVNRSRGHGSKRICDGCSRSNYANFRRETRNMRGRCRRANVPYVRVKDEDILRKYGHRCWICGGVIPKNPKTLAESYSRDHVVPIALGGWHDLPNLRPAHHRCNSLRGAHFEGQLMLTYSA